MSGLIVEAGSPLVQFELISLAHGGEWKGKYGSDERVVIVVNRHPLRELCCAKQPTFAVIEETADYKISAADGSSQPVVCLCMGRFIE